MRAIATAAVLWSATALAVDVGQVTVLDDPNGVIHTAAGMEPLGQTFCKEAAKKFYTTHNDNYDGLITFSTKSLGILDGVQQGTPVRSTAQGIGTDGVGMFNNPGKYGSAGKLSQCVFMSGLPNLPDNPDGPVTVMGGLPLGISGVELVGHEYGHHWLLWIEYDKGDGAGKKTLLRGYEDGPNGHYNYYADSHSVMYGGFVTDNGSNSFTVRGGDRKYSEFDQYLMGLRSPSEVSPMFFVDDGSGQGSAAVPIPKTGGSTNVSGTRVDVSIQDVIRAMGARVPAAASAPHCWRVAFILVAEPGTTATAAQIAKVEAYRARFVEWFRATGTDGRGTMDSRLVAASGCLEPVPDGGIDAGAQPDAGQSSDGGELDGGSPEPFDGGVEGAQDGGQAPDAGAFNPWDDTGKLRPGCGCTGAEGSIGLLALGALLGLRRRRR